MICPVCNGNNKDMPCAYPGESKPGCLKDREDRTFELMRKIVAFNDDLKLNDEERTIVWIACKRLLAESLG